MFLPISKLLPYLPLAGASVGFAAVLAFSAIPEPSIAQEQGEEPIAYVGHGAMFDARGEEVVPTLEWVSRAQDWYRAVLLRKVDDEDRSAYRAFEKRLMAGVGERGQAALVLRQRGLDWLLTRSRKRGGERTIEDERLGSKLGALRYQLTWNLPLGGAERKKRGETIWSGGKFQLPPEIERKLKLRDFAIPKGGVVFLSTVNQGQAYINECAAAGVPIPPTINQMDPNGTAGWKSQGFIPKNRQFIVRTPAEVRTFETPTGMCIALPRYSDDTMTEVSLDGVICLSKTTSKTCFWDNQKGGQTFSFPSGQRIPIGLPDAAIDPAMRYQGGGAELTDPDAGMCTDCHAGENPYIIHPEVELRPGYKMRQLRNDLPMVAPNRYDPIVLASWPQNALSHSPTFVPGECSGCHVQGASSAGRFPHLSNEILGYCNTVLRGAVEGLGGVPSVPPTMPQFAEGSAVGVQAVNDFRAMCNTDPSADPSGRGDPHLTTVNGINYDFQSAGEFVALRNSSNGFELQARQTPVTTSFVPGANPYTGLSSCVSLYTAAALRIGTRRVTYQQEGERMALRVDGRAVGTLRRRLTLGGGSISPVSIGDGIDVIAPDGTRVLITSNYWSSQGYWYLNIEVLGTPAREGTFGLIPVGQWLPMAPDGFRFGPMPAALGARDVLLNQKFASAWRVTPANSLFDYAAGTSPATFADPGWPPKQGGSCSAVPKVPSIPARGRPPIRPIEDEAAQRLCRPLANNKAAFAECVFDVQVMGDPGMAAAFRRSLAVRAAAHKK